MTSKANLARQYTGQTTYRDRLRRAGWARMMASWDEAEQAYPWDDLDPPENQAQPNRKARRAEAARRR